MKTDHLLTSGGGEVSNEGKFLTVDSKVDALGAVEESVRKMKRVLTTILLTHLPQQQASFRPAMSKPSLQI